MTPQSVERPISMTDDETLIGTVAYLTANAKLGESDRVRCEGPSEFEINLAREWTKRVFATAPVAELLKERDEAATLIEDLRQQVEMLEGAVKTCGDKFEEYAELHHAKLAGTSSPRAIEAIMEKVMRNREMADLCRAALTEKHNG